MLEVFQKYNAKWLSLTKADIESSLSGGTLQDVLSYKLSESLSSLTLDEVKERLNKYPLFQEVGDLGNSGSLHQYAVSLNAPNIVSLIDDFSLRLTGS